jgi:hypothetical protein
LGVVGIILFVREYQQSRQILFGHETSKRTVIKTAVMNGLALYLSFLALELLLAGFDEQHIWTTESILVIVTLPLLGFVIVTLGSLWRFYIVGKYRGFMYKKFSVKSEDDRTKVKK